MMPPSISVLNSQNAEESVYGALEGEVPAGQLTQESDDEEKKIFTSEEEVAAWQQCGSMAAGGEENAESADEVLVRSKYVLEADPERVQLADMAAWLGDETFFSERRRFISAK